MSIPGFTAERSTYKGSVHYYWTAARTEGRSSLETQQFANVLPALPLNGGPPPRCTPHCDPCLPDSSSQTGCSKSCMTVACEQVDVPCRGCPGGCAGCSPGQKCCSGTCTNVSSDLRNCGDCGHACPPGSTNCQGGTCYPTPEICSPCNYEVSTQQCCFQPSPGLETCHDQPCCGPGCTPTGPFL
jgi:Stigma-specific protein, Stig1